jgi:hypothetical protein
MTAIIPHLHIASLGMDKFTCSTAQFRETIFKHLEQILDTSFAFEWFLLISDIFDKEEMKSD